MILILDFVFLILCIVVFEITTGQTIDYLFTQDTDDPSPLASKGLIWLTMVCGMYFLLREIVQIVSLLALGNFSAWVWDMGNWLDVCVILLVFFYCAIMLTGEPIESPEAFRSGVAVTKGILWMSVISFLKSTQVEFSVFVSGVFYVVQRLSAFLLALVVILIMFAQMVSDVIHDHISINVLAFVFLPTIPFSSSLCMLRLKNVSVMMSTRTRAPFHIVHSKIRCSKYIPCLWERLVMRYVFYDHLFSFTIEV